MEFVLQLLKELEVPACETQTFIIPRGTHKKESKSYQLQLDLDFDSDSQ